MDRKHLGARSEMIACIWLLNQGFEVFRNVSQHGLVDVIAVKGPTILKLDVKTAANGPIERLSNEAIDAGVMTLSVYADGRCEITKSERRTNQPCASCANPFTPRKNLQIYCSPDCRIETTSRLKREAKARLRSQGGDDVVAS
jgi:hypothetical protein